MYIANIAEHLPAILIIVQANDVVMGVIGLINAYKMEM